MTFEDWLNGIESYGSRYERAIDDIKNCVSKEKTDDIIKWLMAAYAMGHEEGYDTGYSDAEDICEEIRQSDDY